MCQPGYCELVIDRADEIDAIKPIFEDREFEELAQKNSNILSYRRSMSVSPLPAKLI
jgi:DNA polymerase mu